MSLLRVLSRGEYEEVFSKLIGEREDVIPTENSYHRLPNHTPGDLTVILKTCFVS